MVISASAVSDSEIFLKWKQPIEFGQTVANFTVHFVPIAIPGNNTLSLNISKDVANEYFEKVAGLISNTRYFIYIYAFKLVNGVLKRSELMLFNRVQTHRGGYLSVHLLNLFHILLHYSRTKTTIKKVMILLVNFL